MPHKLNPKPDQLFLNLPEKTQKLTDMLLAVNWENVNFDLPDFKYNPEFEHPCLSDSQTELINLILQNIPEWQRLIYCKQHPTHDYDLGIHTLLAIQKVQKTEEYEQLNGYNKLVLLYTILLHDIEKVEKTVDPDHPVKGARTANTVLFRLGFDDEFIGDVCVLIKNHQVLGLMATEKLNLTIPDLVKTVGKPYLVDLLALLAIVDIKSVKRNEAYYSEKVGKNIGIIREEVAAYLQRQL